MNMSLKGLKILVTAGSTWIPIDTVRVITNIFKGSIGYTIALKAAKLKADVTLLLGPSFDITHEKIPNNMKIIRYKYFDDLDNELKNQLQREKFDAVIHSAAVADFKLSKPHQGKIKSNVKELNLRLVPTKKLVDYIKLFLPNTFLVKFKLEVGLTIKQLEQVATNSLKQSNADLIVANLYSDTFTKHCASIIDKSGNVQHEEGKENISDAIFKKINEHYD